MSQLKVQASKNAPTKPSLTQQLVNRGHQFFTLKNICLASLATQVVSTEIRKLLMHVVLGQQEEAKAMILTNPELLLERAATLDYSGRIIIGTAFQIALGAGDEPMWIMMLPYFKDLEPEEALRQFQEQFPNGIKDEVPAEALRDNYNAIARAIIQDVDQDGAVAIETFRQKITAKKEITEGKHFNMQELIAAYQAYRDNFMNLATVENRNLFWQQVIGYVQRQMTAYDAQVHCFSLHDLVFSGARVKPSLRRTLSISGTDFFPMMDSGLGFSFAIFSYCGASRPVAAGSPPVPYNCLAGAGTAIVRLESYAKQKQEDLQDLENRLSKRATRVKNFGPGLV